MFRFWYRYVSSNKTLLETDTQEIVWKKRIEPDYNHYMGHIFEIICRDFLLHQNSQGNLPILFTDIGRFLGTDSKTRQQIEIDLIAQDGNDYLICECKWRNEKLDIPVLKALKEKADAFRTNRGKTWFVLFSKSGFTDALKEEAAKTSDILLYEMNDIL